MYINKYDKTDAPKLIFWSYTFKISVDKSVKTG